jgi:hypothetical protein
VPSVRSSHVLDIAPLGIRGRAAWRLIRCGREVHPNDLGIRGSNDPEDSDWERRRWADAAFEALSLSSAENPASSSSRSNVVILKAAFTQSPASRSAERSPQSWTS